MEPYLGSPPASSPSFGISTAATSSIALCVLCKLGTVPLGSSPALTCRSPLPARPCLPPAVTPYLPCLPPSAPSCLPPARRCLPSAVTPYPQRLPPSATSCP